MFLIGSDLSTAFTVLILEAGDMVRFALRVRPESERVRKNFLNSGDGIWLFNGALPWTL